MPAVPLVTESEAKHRLADGDDAAQERGEVAGRGQPSNVPDGNIKPATAEGIGLTRKEVHEARVIRDAERAEPGIVQRTLELPRVSVSASLRQPQRSAPLLDAEAGAALQGLA